MKIRVLFFAALKDLVSKSEDIYDAEPGETAAGMAIKILGFSSALLFAVNDELVAEDYKLAEGDQLAFIPPMAGG